ncbi:MAG: LytTR family transcriptional regulator DNA-binding domain-containing protein [Pseudomonadota bacterium]
MPTTPQTALNGTVLGVATLRNTLPVAAVTLILLFTAMRPAASAGLGLAERAAFWSLHVLVGLGGIYAASFLIRQAWIVRWHPLVAILLSGVLGAALVAPAYVLIESIMPVPAVDVADDWLDHFAQAGAGQAIVAEVIEVMPMFVLAWAAINLPILLATRRTEDSDGDADPPSTGPSQPNTGSPEANPDKSAFFSRLPAAIGRDLVSISSDLHYLHVHTTTGNAMVIGNLRDVALAFADEGMLVHKSHWVAHSHVVRYVASARQAHCLMTSGSRVPVSRRRRAEVKSVYGSVGTAQLTSVSSK